MNTPTHIGAWEFKGELSTRGPNFKWIWEFDEWTNCRVEDYHDGLHATIKHKDFGGIWLPVSDMRGEWREPMETTSPVPAEADKWAEEYSGLLERVANALIAEREAVAMEARIKLLEAALESVVQTCEHFSGCNAICGPYPETWTEDEKCDCPVKQVRAALNPKEK